jgi:hypothetical protein
MPGKLGNSVARHSSGTFDAKSLAWAAGHLLMQLIRAEADS